MNKTGLDKKLTSHFPLLKVGIICSYIRSLGRIGFKPRSFKKRWTSAHSIWFSPSNNVHDRTFKSCSINCNDWFSAVKEKSFFNSKLVSLTLFVIRWEHGTTIRTRMTCKKISCYMRDSAWRWLIIKNAKLCYIIYNPYSGISFLNSQP